MKVEKAVAQTKRHLGMTNEALNRLSSSLDSSTETVDFEFAPSFGVGSIVEVGNEAMYVMELNGSAATVLRGHDGTEAESHDSGDIAIADPVFTTEEILQELQAEVNAMSADGVYSYDEADVTFDYAGRFYDISDIEGLKSVWEVEWNVGPHFYREHRFNRQNGRLYPYGPPPVPQGRVFFKADLKAPESVDDDLVEDCGLPPTAVDIPSIGAAVRLVNKPKGMRMDPTSQQSARRDESVPIESMSQATQLLKMQRDERVRQEVQKLRQIHPIRW